MADTLRLILADSPEDAAELSAILDVVDIRSFVDILDADDDELRDWAELRDVVAVIGAGAGSAAHARARDAVGRLRGVANEVLAVVYPGARFAWPAGLDTPGSALAWLRNLPRLEAAQNGRHVGNGRHVDHRDDPDGWQALRYRTLPRAEPFPVDTLPEPVARLVSEGARAIGCPPDFLALPALAVAAGAIGRSVTLMLKPGYFAPASLYVACVGPPSDGKTPALKSVAIAARRIDEALADEHRQAVEAWEEESSRVGPDGKKSNPGPRPRPRRIDVDDITMEALPLILADNPRGLVMIRDELTALVLGLNQYKSGGKGNDRAIMLKIWSGDAIKRDRVSHEGNEPIRCPHPCLSIIGGLTPDMLGSMADPKGRADGFIDRFVAAYPEPLPVAGWTDAGISEDVMNDWCSLAARLWRRPMRLENDRETPHVARFDPDGKKAWARAIDAHADRMNAPDFPAPLRGAWGKLRDHAARLALVLACLDHAADPLADPEGVPPVGADVVARTWRLVAYLEAHARRVHSAVAGGAAIGGGKVVESIVEWLRDGRRASFSERDLKQARRWIEPDALADALNYLIDRHAIRPIPRGDRPGAGRPGSPEYAVNPRLLDSHNPQNTQNPDVGGHFEDSEYFEKPIEVKNGRGADPEGGWLE